MDCCDNSGGRIILTVNGKRYHTRGGVTIRPQHKSRDVGANDDGSLYVTTKPEPAEAEFTLSDKCGLNIEDLTDSCYIDATFDMIDMKKKFFFTRASVVGRPEYKTDTGEISGLKIVSALVRQQAY